MDIFKANRCQVKKFIQYFSLWKLEKAESSRLQNLAEKVSRARRKDFKTGQFLFFNEVQDRFIEGVLI